MTAREEALNLRLSGPTPLSPAVRMASATQVIGHRSEPFREMLERVIDWLQPVFGTKSHVLPFTASGTGGLEAAIVNSVCPGDRVLALSSGYFGSRFADIASTHGARVDLLETPWGSPVDIDLLVRQLRRRRYTAITLTDCETSTGVKNDLVSIGPSIREQSDALLLVDVVGSLATAPLKMDDLSIDVAIGVTQKGLMSPPGLTLLAVSDRAITRAATLATRSYYFDFNRMLGEVRHRSTSFTPAVTVVAALEKALESIHEGGLMDWYQRHATNAATCHRAAEEHKLGIAAVAGYRAPSITALVLPDGIKSSTVREHALKQSGVLCSGGRGPWKETVVRIAHLGHTSQPLIRHAVDAVAEAVAAAAA
jgi:aspartate aminotransferase-like enzyme